MVNRALERVTEQRDEVLGLAERRGARNVRVFGSVARGDDGPTSDVDLIVDLDDGVSLIGLAGLQNELSDLRDRVLNEAVPI